MTPQEQRIIEAANARGLVVMFGKDDVLIYRAGDFMYKRPHLWQGDIDDAEAFIANYTHGVKK